MIHLIECGNIWLCPSIFVNFIMRKSTSVVSKFEPANLGARGKHITPRPLRPTSTQSFLGGGQCAPHSSKMSFPTENRSRADSRCTSSKHHATCLPWGNSLTLSVNLSNLGKEWYRILYFFEDNYMRSLHPRISKYTLGINTIWPSPSQFILPHLFKCVICLKTRGLMPKRAVEKRAEAWHW